MAKVTRIKATGFCDHIDHAVTTEGVFIVKKHRPTDIKGVYKATEAFQLELDAKDIPGLITNKHGELGCSTVWDVVDYYKAKGLLPNERLLVHNDNYTWDFVNRNGFNPNKPPYIRKDTVTLTVFAISDFVKLKPTPKEKAILDKLDNRSKMQSLNTMVFKDNLLKVLKDNNYEVSLRNATKEHSAIYFNNKKSFNALTKDAIEYYLNNIVLKDLGCKITVPKQNTTHCYKYDDPLCYIGDVEMVNEGE